MGVLESFSDTSETSITRQISGEPSPLKLHIGLSLNSIMLYAEKHAEVIEKSLFPVRRIPLIVDPTSSSHLQARLVSECCSEIPGDNAYIRETRA